jgi:hypothetical protein
VAADDSVTVVTGDSVVLRPLLNDRDPDGDALTITRLAKPRHGTAVAGLGGEVTYAAGGTPAGLLDTFGYTIADGRGVTVHVAAAHTTPVTGRDTVTLIRFGLLTVTAGGLLYWLGGRGTPGLAAPRSRNREPS